MHYSAKRGLAIACRSSVRPSVTLGDCDHTCWKSGKCRRLAQYLRSSLPKGHSPTPRGTWGDFGETRRNGEIVACWSTKASITLKRVKIEEKLLWMAYRNSPMLFFRRHHARLPMPSSPRLEVCNPTQNYNRKLREMSAHRGIVCMEGL